MAKVVPALLALALGAGALFGAVVIGWLVLVLGPVDGGIYLSMVLVSVAAVALGVRAAARRSRSSVE